MEPYVMLAGFVVLALLSMNWHLSRSGSLLQRWASENGYRILRQEYRQLFRGPFFWTTSKGQTVYYVVVQDERGCTRSGWVRCGGFWFGLLTDKVEVRWED